MNALSELETACRISAEELISQLESGDYFGVRTILSTDEWDRLVNCVTDSLIETIEDRS